MWESNPAISPAYVAANPQFAGESARTVFEQVVSDLASAGLMVVLDNHTSGAQWCCSTSDGNTLWYNSAYPQSAWLSDWESMTRQLNASWDGAALPAMLSDLQAIQPACPANSLADGTASPRALAAGSTSGITGAGGTSSSLSPRIPMAITRSPTSTAWTSSKIPVSPAQRGRC